MVAPLPGDIAMKRFILMVLLTGVPIGAITAFNSASRMRLDEALGVGVGAGLVFGLLMAGVFTAFLRYFERNPGKGKLRRSCQYVLSRDYDDAFDICLRSLDDLGRKVAVKTRDPAGGEIVANTGMTWKTFGDRIAFRIRKVSDESTEVEVESRPIIPLTMVDYGSNRENIEAIGRALAQHG